MEETQAKRPREGDNQFGLEEEEPKRHRPYNTILNLLDDDDDDEDEEQDELVEPTHQSSQDLSAIFSTLQQELSPPSTSSSSSSSSSCIPPSVAAAPEAPAASGGDEEDAVKSVMRHLLEASDDELGIPNRTDDYDNNNINKPETLNFSGGDSPYDFVDQDGLWELEDEAANYYTVLQSELFRPDYYYSFF